MFKIGQRVLHANAEFYIEKIVGDAAVIGNEKITHTVRLDRLSPLYKPGDTVRIKSRDELKKDYATGRFMELFAGTTQVLDSVYGDDGEFTLWNFKDGGDWILKESRFEWHSEEKPERDEVLDSMKYMLIARKQILDAMRAPPKIMGIDLAEGYSKPVDFLPAEVHQDKERNRAVLAEELNHKPYFRIKYRCLEWKPETQSGCQYTGTQLEVKEHMQTEHGLSVPSFASGAWDSWRVR